MDAINESNVIQSNQQISQQIKTTINGNINDCYMKTLNQKMMSSEDQFNAAVNVIRKLPKNGPFQPSDEMKLKFYAYYKQATEGPNITKKPAFYDIVNRYKWDAWKKLGNMDRQTAMDSYIEELKKVIETMSFNESVSEFYEVLGPFHEFLPQETNGETNGSIETALDRINENLNDTKTKIGKKSSKMPFKDNPHLNGEEDINGIDSEGEEFSDTYDHIGENGEIPVVERNGTDFSIENIVSARGGNSSNPSAQISPTNQSNERNDSSIRNRNIREPGIPFNNDSNPINTGGAGGSGNAGGGSNSQYSIGINEQLALAVIRLQQSMDQVVNRLDALESTLSRETRSRTRSDNSNKRPKLWPFNEITAQTAVVLLVWPFVANWIIHYIQQKRRK